MERIEVLNTRAQIFKHGSVYFDGLAAHPGFNCGSGNFDIGDTVAGMELRWIQMGNILVADQCLCLGISWDMLNSLGYIFGRQIFIDGQPYLCRSLKVGTEKTVDSSEWNALLKIESANTIIHWKNTYSWGQEILKEYPERRAARGFFMAHNWTHRDSMCQDQNMGFRPVLEPLISDLSDITVGSNMKVYGPHGQTVEGILIGFTEYDLTVKAEPSDADLVDWAVRCGEEIIVNRSALVGIGESVNES